VVQLHIVLMSGTLAFLACEPPQFIGPDGFKSGRLQS